MADIVSPAQSRESRRILLLEDFEGIATHWLLATSNPSESARVAWQAYKGHAAFQLTTVATPNDTASIQWVHPGPEGARIRVSAFIYIPYTPASAEIILQYNEVTRTTNEDVIVKYNTQTHEWQWLDSEEDFNALNEITTRLPTLSWILLSIEFSRRQKRLTLVQINNERYRMNREYRVGTGASFYTQASTQVKVQTLAADKASIIIDEIATEEL